MYFLWLRVARLTETIIIRSTTGLCLAAIVLFGISSSAIVFGNGTTDFTGTTPNRIVSLYALKGDLRIRRLGAFYVSPTRRLVDCHTVFDAWTIFIGDLSIEISTWYSVTDLAKQSARAHPAL